MFTSPQNCLVTQCTLATFLSFLLFIQTLYLHITIVCIFKRVHPTQRISWEPASLTGGSRRLWCFLLTGARWLLALSFLALRPWACFLLDNSVSWARSPSSFLLWCWSSCFSYSNFLFGAWCAVAFFWGRCSVLYAWCNYICLHRFCPQRGLFHVPCPNKLTPRALLWAWDSRQNMASVIANWLRKSFKSRWSLVDRKQKNLYVKNRECPCALKKRSHV